MVLTVARRLLASFLLAWLGHEKAGVMLHNLGRPERLQGDLSAARRWASLS